MYLSFENCTQKVTMMIFLYPLKFSFISLFNQHLCSRNADVAVFDAGDIYTAGLYYDLIPFIAEVYNLGTPEFYVVAIAKEEDPSTELTYLKGKCVHLFY